MNTPSWELGIGVFLMTLASIRSGFENLKTHILQIEAIRILEQ